MASALGWCLDLLDDGLAPAQIRGRIRVGDITTLLNIPGAHLLTGHIGKGQQFDWVLILGAEDGCIPDFRNLDDDASLQEEARILAVMMSRARHGVVISSADTVPAKSGSVFRKEPSRFLSELQGALTDRAGLLAWFEAVDWKAVAAR